MLRILVLLSFLVGAWGEAQANAQESEEGEPSFQVNGSLKLQSGVFVPLLSDLFTAQQNEAYEKLSTGQWTTTPCDPVIQPSIPCTPKNHGMDAGSLSMFRATLQLEADWILNESIELHTIVRGVRSLELDADGWAQIPKPSSSTDPKIRRAEAREWAHDRFYTEFDLREFYMDAFLSDSLSFRIGRQQVTWGEIGSYRLLDMVNPIDNTWHFGPLESFEDTRIPLWIVKGMIEFADIDQSLELLWVPGLDRPEDLVTTPLSFVGAWGPPRTNTPASFIIDETVFMYPENSIEDTMRVGFRWKGTLGSNMTYSLIYYYTHQLDTPIPAYYDLRKISEGNYDPNHMDRLYIKFPRQHIAGFSFDWAVDNPIGAVLRLEASVEPDRTFPQISGTRHTHRDSARLDRYYFDNPKKMALNYAVMVMRPTMIRFLNPTQNFLLVFQWMHTIVPVMTEEEKNILVQVPGFDDWKLEQHSMSLVFVAATQYLNGFLSPSVMGVYIIPDSGFISAAMDFRLGTHWRAKLAVTDFFGADPYRGVGLFRDRDEINLSLTCLF